MDRADFDNPGRIKFRVNEIYGPVAQGEGVLIGTPTMFVRLQGCDSRCEWCDTPYALDFNEGKEMTLQEIFDEVASKAGNCRLVTFSGGNPLAQDLTQVPLFFHSKGNWSVALETQGTIFQHCVNFFNSVAISPKPPSSGCATSFEDLARFFADGVYNKNKFLKIVVFNTADYEYAVDVHLTFPNIAMILQVGNEVGEFSTKDLIDALRALTELALDDDRMQDVRVLPQLHVLLYQNRRGV